MPKVAGNSIQNVSARKKYPNKLTEASLALPRPLKKSVCSSPRVAASFEEQDQSAVSCFHPDQFANSPPNTLQTKGQWV